MLIANGHIKIKTITGGGYINGIGQDMIESWGDSIECEYSPNQYSNLGVVNGNVFTQHSYEVLVEMQPIGKETLKLYDSDGNEVGEFQVISAERLPHVDMVKIKI